MALEYEQKFIERAILLSEESVSKGGYPVGAVVVLDEEIIGTGLSDGKQMCDATHHAEIAAMREASQAIGKRNLTGATLYSSAEPCVMCLMACSWSYIEKVCYASRRNQLTRDFFEGDHDNGKLNRVLSRPLEYIHLDAFEDRALEVVNAWNSNK